MVLPNAITRRRETASDNPFPFASQNTHIAYAEIKKRLAETSCARGRGRGGRGGGGGMRVPFVFAAIITNNTGG